MKNYRRETICVQGGYEPKNGEPRITPIVQSTTYKYDSADHVADLFDLKAAGHMYTRISNPTLDVLEKKIAQLEGGVGALATSSGQTATLLTVLTLCQQGDEIVAMNNLYGGSLTLLSSTIKKLGIDAKFVALNDQEALKEAIGPKTRLVFAETLANPGVEVLDIEACAKTAHEHGIPLVVDNTFATPYLCRPFEFGADIVTHSATKYLDGHATSVGGLIVDSGNFDWEANKFSVLTDPDPNYHGLSYTETFGRAAFITKARVVYIRDFGTPMAPFNAFLTNLGTETLALRMDKHSENALEVAKYLEAHPKVKWVKYPGLKSSPYYDLAKKYLERGASGVISFGIDGSLEETKKWIDSLKLASLVVHVGDLRSHALHPASMTHRQLSKEALKKAGIDEGTIRFSVGLEHIDDILEDLEQAFNEI